MPRVVRYSKHKPLTGDSLMCTKCKQTLPLTAFRTTKTVKGTLYFRGPCRACEPRSSARGTKAGKLKRSRTYRQRVRAEVLERYGGSCACCGETTTVFLTIDHVNGYGGKRGITGTGLWANVRRDGFSSEYRLLCFNCNCTRRKNMWCPAHTHLHEEQRRSNAV